MTVEKRPPRQKSNSKIVEPAVRAGIVDVIRIARRRERRLNTRHPESPRDRERLVNADLEDAFLNSVGWALKNYWAARNKREEKMPALAVGPIASALKAAWADHGRAWKDLAWREESASAAEWLHDPGVQQLVTSVVDAYEAEMIEHSATRIRNVTVTSMADLVTQRLLICEWREGAKTLISNIEDCARRTVDYWLQVVRDDDRGRRAHRCTAAEIQDASRWSGDDFDLDRRNCLAYVLELLGYSPGDAIADLSVL